MCCYHTHQKLCIAWGKLERKLNMKRRAILISSPFDKKHPNYIDGPLKDISSFKRFLL
jgi:hypothetical protein